MYGINHRWKRDWYPRPRIDTDARLGCSHTKVWVFGYKLHLTSTTGALAVPLTAADVTTTNVQDNQMYIPLASSPSSPSSSSSSVFPLPSLRYMTADPGYDDKKLYGHGKKDLGN